MSVVESVNGETGVVVLDATDVGAIPSAEKGAPNGVASLNSSTQLPEAQLPSSVVNSSAATKGLIPVANGTGGYNWESASGSNVETGSHFDQVPTWSASSSKYVPTSVGLLIARRARSIPGLTKPVKVHQTGTVTGWEGAGFALDEGNALETPGQDEHKQFSSTVGCIKITGSESQTGKVEPKVTLAGRSLELSPRGERSGEPLPPHVAHARRLP